MSIETKPIRGVGRFVKSPGVIEAIQLTWPNWSEVCDFVPKEAFIEGVYLDENFQPTTDPAGGGKIGLRVETLGGPAIVREGEYILRRNERTVSVMSKTLFESLYEPIDSPPKATADSEAPRCMFCEGSGLALQAGTATLDALDAGGGR